MIKVIVSFVISALIGLGLGYVVFKVLPVQAGHDPQVAAGTTETTSTETSKDQNSETKETATQTTSVD